MAPCCSIASSRDAHSGCFSQPLYAPVVALLAEGVRKTTTIPKSATRPTSGCVVPPSSPRTLTVSVLVPGCSVVAFHSIPYVHMFIYIYIYICICLYDIVYICIYVYTYMCIYVYTSIRLYVYTYIFIYLYMYMCTCIYIYMCMCTYVYMYIYMYVYIYICIYVCIYVNSE